MYPFVKSVYKNIEVEDRKLLCSYSYKVCSALKQWTIPGRQTATEYLDKIIEKFEFIKKDLANSRAELGEFEPPFSIPAATINYIRNYLEQFYVIRDAKLVLPKIDAPVKDSKPVISMTSVGKPKVRAILEEIWWVIRVKDEYRMCRLTFDRGAYWEMVEYQGTDVLNPQYRFPKYDNRIVYEFREHIVPEMFKAKIAEAVRIRKEALTAQAEKMLEVYDTVLIARHLNAGTVVGGVEAEDENNWYLDTYDEDGEHLFYGDNRWVLDKKSRCTVVQILRRK